MKTTHDWQFEARGIPEQWIKTRIFTRLCLVLTMLSFIAVVSAPLARFYLDVPAMLAFQVFFYSLQAGLILALSGLIIILIAAFKKITHIRNNALFILLSGILPVITVLIILGPDKLRSPMIHDITTDPIDPPQFMEALKLRTENHNPLEYAGGVVAKKQLQAYPDIRPVLSTMNYEDAMQEAIQTTKDLGWEFINIDFDLGIIETYDTTSIFGFVDDIIVRVRREGTGSCIDVRSASRVGKGDLGKNADRIRQFIRTFRQE